MTNQFDNKGDGDQNNALGDGAVGKQVNNYGVPFEDYRKLGGKLDVTESALTSFFKILEERQVSRSDLDSKLREIAKQYKELLLRLETVQSADPEVKRLKEEARQAIEAGDYAKAEELLNQADARDVQAIEQLEDAARQRRISAAASNVDNASLQRVQLRYAKAAAYWRTAAERLPQDQKQERALYLHEAGYDFHRVASYSEALPLYEESLAISQEIGDKAGEGATLNNLATTAYAKGDYPIALKYLEQSLSICQEIGGKSQEGTTLNNISGIYKARGDYDTALKYLEQNLILFREIGDKAHEGGTLNNISQIYKARGDYPIALKYLEQSLSIRQEIGDKAGEAITSWNIGRIYQDQSDLSKADQYMSRTVEIDEAIGHPDLEKDRKGLAAVRAKIKER